MTEKTAFLMEPMLPPEGDRRLEDLAIELTAKSAALAGQLPYAVQLGVGDRVRSMNCYYSNLIEGHDTHPRDIDRALASSDYASDPEKRALQLEAVAHIEVQRLIDHGKDPQSDVISIEYIKWLHRSFCKNLPEELLIAKNYDTGENIRIIPGELRTGCVQVGHHIPPNSIDLQIYLERFEEAYKFNHLSKLRRLIALGAAHHRLLWIHPFYDGNGRVARLLAHAFLLRCGVGNSLWSVARGLSRNVQEYKQLLMTADSPRRGDFDGRGNLSQKALTEFCIFFLSICIDQIEFMASLLEPSKLLNRMQIHIEGETKRGSLPKGSFPLLREALLAGEVPRGRVTEITGYAERNARTVTARLLEKGYLKSDSSRSSLILAFPMDAAENWFPRLYPPMESSTMKE